MLKICLVTYAYVTITGLCFQSGNNLHSIKFPHFTYYPHIYPQSYEKAQFFL